ncbi:MAG TPA: hypothetical protein VK210_01430, partial [Terriglobia bacterium]|nr:hypothetical protein [Terriglobia bacterium]
VRTNWKLGSLETKFSDVNVPPGSENSVIIRQNVGSSICLGSGSADTVAPAKLTMTTNAEKIIALNQ